MSKFTRIKFACAHVHGLPRVTAAAALVLAFASCGGGGSSDPSPPPPGPISDAQRISAATATAQSASNACNAVRPFYWEVGDQTGRVAMGSVQSGGGPPVYTGATVMNIASASKWLYGAYVVQRRLGLPTADDIKFLTFRSGYTSFSNCLPNQTVDECVAFEQNNVHSPATDGRFSYGGGHMEKYASLLGLGALGNGGLAAEMRSQLGTDISLSYSQPQLAGGVVSSADAYAVFLRKLLAGSLQMSALLGNHAVCTNPATCPAGEAVNTPVPANLSWHYSLGHWVEDDPVAGDGAFSSAGAFGFYPWIDAGKRWYGIVARMEVGAGGNGFDSAQCGALIRKAWVTGQE